MPPPVIPRHDFTVNPLDIPFRRKTPDSQVNEMIPWIRSDTCYFPARFNPSAYFTMPKACCTLSHINCGLAKKASSNTVLRSRKLRANNIRNPRIHFVPSISPRPRQKPPLPTVLYGLFYSFPTDCPPFFFTLYWELPLPSFFRRKVFSMLPIFHPRPNREEKTTYSFLRETLLVLGNQIP